MTTGDESPRTFGDHYVLAEQIAASDDSEVWNAHDDLVSRRVALKIFFGPRASDPAWQAAFRYDAGRLATLSHPGIAKLYEHDQSDREAWLAMAFVAGEPLATRLASDEPLPVAEALDVLGQTALAVKAAHDVGTAHGAISADNLLIRGDRVVCVIGFAVGTTPTRAADLRALGALTTHCFEHAETPLPDDARDFLNWLTDPRHAAPPTDAAEIGRTALALAASLGGQRQSAVVPSPTPAADADDTAPGGSRYDEAERRMVRNRLLVLGTIVVVGGAALLRFVGKNGGEVTVPPVVGLQVSAAQLNLTRAGLRSIEDCTVGTDSGNTIVRQSPVAGRHVKAGSNVILTISAASCP